MSGRLLTIVGARPQFIKASVVSHAIKQVCRLREVLLHTGQHFDETMSAIFFRQLNIPLPNINLGIHGGAHGKMTGRMLEGIEEAILSVNPDRVIVYGDTNSTLAGALAAAKLRVPIAHVEAGLRSFDRSMPEEINRLIADQVSDILFCPTENAVSNLAREGIRHGEGHSVYNVGDVMEDAARVYSGHAHPPTSANDLPRHFILATIHRAENTDDSSKLRSLVSAMNRVNQEFPVVMPLHPRARDAVARLDLKFETHVIEPTGYLEMLWLLQNCSLVATDSGGLQKEAFFHGKPCVTLRDSTEWIELVAADANVLVGADECRIVDAIRSRLGQTVSTEHEFYGGGRAAERIVKLLELDT